VLIVTHKTTRSSLTEALTGMAETGVVSGQPVALRIEEL
jgi:homoserine dehydrogenase